ncbi:MAG: DNA mismatch repair endonuclease MutL [Terriglobia bacterium]|jgi:DNA mismatch repair protein MutL
MTQSSVIRILPEAVANKIAAGEVVERPASVVKELMENALDAGAGRVEVSVEAGGKRRITITDDGCGMSHDDALLAFERHATSKIRTAEDLFEISTLGFRGEALPSIAAVSRLELETRHTSENAGTRIEIAGGKIRDVKEVAWPQGTRVDVHDLFFNTPARRKFLKSESTELGHIATLVTHYALAHPERSFRLVSLTNEILNVSPVETARERVYQVMGGQLLEQMVEVAPVERRMPAAYSVGPEEDGEGEEPGVVRVFGFASRPEVQKLNRNQIYFFVNRRLVRDRLILHAITEAYRNILPSGMFPVALVFLEIPAAEVDVNVHPSKTEVRFRRSQFIHDLVRGSVRQSLVAARPVAAFPLGKSQKRPTTDLLEAEASERLSDEPPGMRGPEISGPSRPPQRRDDFRLSSPRPVPETGRLPLDGAELSFYAPPPMTGASGVEPIVEIPASAGISELPGDLIPLGQVQESFIVATNPEGLWIVDQHAAHERVLFEQHVRQRREKKVEGQRLLMPIVVELKPEQQAVYQQIADELGANGFEVEPFGQRTVAVKSAPAEIRADDVERLLLEILDSVGQEAKSLSLDDLRLKIAASVSCHAAIKINMRLEQGKMVWLLRALGDAQAPMTCPHGRPIVLRYGMKDLQKAFKRI